MMLQERCRKGIFGDDRGVLPLLSQQFKHGLLCWPVELIFITMIAGIPVLPNPMTVFSSTKGVLSFSRERRKPLLIYPVFGFCVELLETKSNACLCSPEHCSLHTARQAFMDSMHCSYPRPLIALPCSLLHTTFQQSPLHNT